MANDIKPDFSGPAGLRGGDQLDDSATSRRSRIRDRRIAAAKARLIEATNADAGDRRVKQGSGDSHRRPGGGL